MDIESFYLIFLIGSFTSLLNASISFLSQVELNQRVESGDPVASKIQYFRNKYDDTLNSLFVIEILFYLLGSIYFLDYVDSFNFSINFQLFNIFIYFLLIILVRIVFYYVGVRFADHLAYRLVFFTTIFTFLGSFTSVINSSLLQITGGIHTPDEAKDEISAVVESAREDGSIDDDEYRILNSIMRFSDVFVEDVMTPRTVVFSCKADMKVSDAIKLDELKNYSRVPLWEGESIDRGLKGYVMTRDVLHAALIGQGDYLLKDLSKELHMIGEETPLDDTLEKFLKRKQHILAVLDEYGGFEGIITMEDVLETIIGAEIVDEADQETDLRLIAKRKRDKRISNK